ncbi:hypothetical protein ACSTK1_10490 [Vibrio parahaemolyticus]|uniref:hypothetical protein n=1 Tax=Vibrio TaxID=662 RepID=UPI0009981B12|nr:MULTISPECIES: hypothetical protein [Vibrio harveyi group]HAS6050605.1 hypothetical protein [Vibrio vulnificus]EIV8502222.1 hypothetical protein [Vibrio parahaemolyticus]EJG1749524.1 hypothetical protein [Vibrio parahaemolyticus]MBE4032472.1 hypothetical protein [Vibrio parahaemolyticus]MBE4332206.1 hypothetical protein [Vibrio parahaemolyticus]
MNEWFPAITTTSILGGVIWLSKSWLLTRLKGSIAHEYSQELESVKSQLRKTEDNYKSELNKSEQRIDVLQSEVLSQVSARYTTLYSRQMTAIEQLWEAVLVLGSAKSTSSTMSQVDYDAAIKAAATDQKAVTFFETVCKYDMEKLGNAMSLAAKQRPFVSVVSWAYYAAYQAILTYSIAQVELLKLGLDQDFTDSKSVVKLVKLALPHQSENIDKFGVNSCHYLLEELETKMLESFAVTLNGDVADNESLERAAKIISQSEALLKEAQGVNSKA